MQIKLIFPLLAVFLLCFASLAEAQGRRGGGRGISRTALALNEQVQDELEVTDEQKEQLAEMRQAGRRGGEGGERRRGESEQGDRPPRRGEGGERSNRQRRGPGGGAQSLERVQAEIDGLAEVLLPHQMERLSEIYVQVMGQRAINDPVIASQLEISDDQKSEMEEIQSDMREEMMSLRETVEREEMREKMTEMMEETNKKMFAVLSDSQRKQLDKMKGKEFDIDMEDLAPRRGRNRGRSDF